MFAGVNIISVNFDEKLWEIWQFHHLRSFVESSSFAVEGQLSRIQLREWRMKISQNQQCRRRYRAFQMLIALFHQTSNFLWWIRSSPRRWKFIHLDGYSFFPRSRHARSSPSKKIKQIEYWMEKSCHVVRKIQIENFSHKIFITKNH